MNRISQSLASLAILGLTGVASATVVVDGYTFDYAYTGDGDVLPTASTPAWTTGGSGAASVSGGILTIDTTTNDGKYFDIAMGGEFNPTATPGEKSYVQFRAKVNSEVSGVRFGTQFFISSNNRMLALQLGEFDGNTGVFDSLSALVATVDVYQWHTYRFEWDTNAPSYTLWIDAFNTPVISGASSFAGNYPGMYFGDGSGDTQGNVEFDYVAWTNSGVPVPEPAAPSLLGLGALALRRRK